MQREAPTDSLSLSVCGWQQLSKQRQRQLCSLTQVLILISILSPIELSLLASPVFFFSPYTTTSLICNLIIYLLTGGRCCLCRRCRCCRICFSHLVTYCLFLNIPANILLVYCSHRSQTTAVLDRFGSSSERIYFLFLHRSESWPFASPAVSTLSLHLSVFLLLLLLYVLCCFYQLNSTQFSHF